MIHVSFPYTLSDSLVLTVEAAVYEDGDVDDIQTFVNGKAVDLEHLGEKIGGQWCALHNTLADKAREEAGNVTSSREDAREAHEDLRHMAQREAALDLQGLAKNICFGSVL